MFLFTVVQNRTHVDTVHSVLQGLTISRDICWSHTMKVLGWRVTFVRRNSATVVTSSNTYFDMKVWSLMYVVTVQSVFVQYVNWNLINWYTQPTNSFAVVCVVKISNTNIMVCNTLRNVLLSCNLVTFNLRYLLICICCCPRIPRYTIINSLYCTHCLTSIEHTDCWKSIFLALLFIHVLKNLFFSVSFSVCPVRAPGFQSYNEWYIHN